MKRERLSTDITRIQFDSMEEWLVNRKGIGGSDASAILGLNPYKTNQELWKSEIKFPDSFFSEMWRQWNP